MTVTCLHCGPVPVTDPSQVHATRGIVTALAIGHAPLGAITCPQCCEEVRARFVYDDKGHAVAPVAGNVLPERPDGPWSSNGGGQ